MSIEFEGPPFSGRQAARILGVSYPTFRRAIDSGAVPGVFRLGKLVKVPRRIIWALLNGEPIKRTVSHGQSTNASQGGGP